MAIAAGNPAVRSMANHSVPFLPTLSCTCGLSAISKSDQAIECAVVSNLHGRWSKQSSFNYWNRLCEACGKCKPAGLLPLVASAPAAISAARALALP